MKRNRIISLIAATVLSLTMLAGCGNKSDFKDGKYKAEYDKEDTRGWKAFTEIEVKGGKIVSANYDYVNKEGKLKSKDEGYNKAMKEKSKTSPAEYGPALGKALVDKQDPAKVDKVTGATHSWEQFKEQAQKLIEEKLKRRYIYFKISSA
ncbi:FMN-binding protein [Clostridium polynesiense]|uniref:FMN-binding protein n=1 Tax=Clostridium polynesiense TaxID=1325933 RepID=UPI000694D361|nr:FMN-binding protein [Clostridium polynesiense]